MFVSPGGVAAIIALSMYMRKKKIKVTTKEIKRDIMPKPECLKAPLFLSWFCASLPTVLLSNKVETSKCELDKYYSCGSFSRSGREFKTHSKIFLAVSTASIASLLLTSPCGTGYRESIA